MQITSQMRKICLNTILEEYRVWGEVIVGILADCIFYVDWKTSLTYFCQLKVIMLITSTIPLALKKEKYIDEDYTLQVVPEPYSLNWPCISIVEALEDGSVDGTALRTFSIATPAMWLTTQLRPPNMKSTAVIWKGGTLPII
jgi:hypothetical protein